MTGTQSFRRPLRADAARNQTRILDAARTLFGKKGLDVSLNEIAHDAGVGVATLYRRFPDRQSLVAALFELQMRNTVELARTALAASDAWEGLVTLLRTMFRTGAEDKGIRQAFLSSRNGLHAANASRAELTGLLGLIVQRAQAQGHLRRGIDAQDVPALLLMVGVVADFASDVSPSLWERYATLLIDGLSTTGRATDLCPDPLSGAEMAHASSCW